MRSSSRGIALTLASSMMLTVSDALTKLVADALPLGQIVVTQSLVVMTAVLGFGVWTGRHRWREVARWRLHGLRAVLNVLAMVLFLLGLVRLPLATAIALAFTSPLILQLIAPWLAGERADPKRLAAVAFGFAGVAIALHPGSEGFSYAVLLPLGSAIAAALRDLVTRRIAATDPSEATMFWAVVGNAVAGVAWTGGDLVIPVSRDLVLLGVMSLAFLAALYTMIEALRFAEASIVAPFKYSALVWAVAFDVAFWGRLPGWSVLIGAAMIVASLLIILRRERKLTALGVDGAPRRT